MSFKFGSKNRKDRVASRFLGQAHAVLSRSALEVSKERGLTKAQVARELGVDRSTISRLLSGVGNPTLRTIGELAGVMGYRPELVFHKVEPKPGSNIGALVMNGMSVASTPRNETGDQTALSRNVYSPKAKNVPSVELR